MIRNTLMKPVRPVGQADQVSDVNLPGPAFLKPVAGFATGYPVDDLLEHKEGALVQFEIVLGHTKWTSPAGHKMKLIPLIVKLELPNDREGPAANCLAAICSLYDNAVFSNLNYADALELVDIVHSKSTVFWGKQKNVLIHLGQGV